MVQSLRESVPLPPEGSVPSRAGTLPSGGSGIRPAVTDALLALADQASKGMCGLAGDREQKDLLRDRQRIRGLPGAFVGPDAVAEAIVGGGRGARVMVVADRGGGFDDGA